MQFNTVSIKGTSQKSCHDPKWLYEKISLPATYSESLHMWRNLGEVIYRKLKCRQRHLGEFHPQEGVGTGPKKKKRTLHTTPEVENTKKPPKNTATELYYS